MVMWDSRVVNRQIVRKSVASLNLGYFRLKSSQGQVCNEDVDCTSCNISDARHLHLSETPGPSQVADYLVF